MYIVRGGRYRTWGLAVNTSLRATGYVAPANENEPDPLSGTTAISLSPVSPWMDSPGASATTRNDRYRHPTSAGVTSISVPGPAAGRTWRTGASLTRALPR